MSDPSVTLDEKVLQLRGEGQGYTRISRELGLERAAHAQQAFRRALLRLPDADAEPVRTAELTRLDRLAAKVRADANRNDVDRARQLKTIARMRQQVSDAR